MASGRREAEVLVVGAGVIGLSAALALLQDGRSVTLLEAGTPGCGSSHGNCGTITPSHAPPLAAPGQVLRTLRWMLRPDAPFYLRPRWDPALLGWLARFARRCNRRDWQATTRVKAPLLQRSRRLLEALVQREGLECCFDASGLWYVFRDQATLHHIERELADLRALGIAADVLGRDQALAAEPALRDDIAAVVSFPGDAMLRPDRLVTELVQRVEAQGGRIASSQRVERIEAGGGQVRCHTPAGEWRAPHLVLAGGAWSPALGSQLGVRIPVQPGKGYSITYPRPPLVPLRPLVLKERSVCVTAWEDGFRLGSTMEFSGYDTRLDPLRLDALERGAAEYLKVPHGGERQEQWYGWRPMSCDDLPIIGPHPRAPGVVFATGHGMLGVTLSAVTAEIVADLVAGRPPALDIAPFSPQRFS